MCEPGSDGLDEIDTLLLDKKFRSTYKGHALKCAKQLGYSRDVQECIKNATDDLSIERIMYQAAKDTRDQRDRELGRM